MPNLLTQWVQVWVTILFLNPNRSSDGSDGSDGSDKSDDRFG
ncbi:hypothetical protein [Prevotella ihumii]|nr:hypothetical protein [Prevotella ihumii]